MIPTNYQFEKDERVTEVTHTPERTTGDTEPSGPPPPARAGARTGLARTLDKMVRRGGSSWTFAILVLLIIIFWILSGSFISKASWIATSTYATEYVLISVGQTFVIVAAGLDLSVGGVLALSGMTSAWMMNWHVFSGMPVVPLIAIGLVVALATGALVGVINGALVTSLKISPLIVTLGTMGICDGLVDLMGSGQPIVGVPGPISTFGTLDIGGWLPETVLATAAVAVVAGLLLARTRFGLRTYAVGSSSESARRHGVNVTKHVALLYTISGLCAGIAGFVVLARYGEANPLAGQNDNMNSIAAVVIGGASLFGGIGSIFGTVVGALVLSVLVTGLVTANIPAFWQPVAVGVVLILAVFLDQFRKRLSVR